MGRLAGKVAIITGAGTGIGRACLEIFAREGAVVIGTGRREAPLKEAAQAAAARGGQVTVLQCDGSREDDVRSMIAQVTDSFGRLDILVNNAGIGGNSYGTQREGGMASLAETPSEHWHELLRNNLDSAFYGCKYGIAAMRASGGGSIVNVCSTAAIQPRHYAHAYSATKAAIVNMTRSIAVRYGREGIRANAVCPGPTDTPMMAGAPVMAVFGDPDDPRRYRQNPMGRAGLPEEMAHGILFFASDEASYVNGAVLPIDGGMISSPA
jgi:NAD(P)-dependent dehydrogenase (short-subunit alcohol dehydrogenase family)